MLVCLSGNKRRLLLRLCRVVRRKLGKNKGLTGRWRFEKKIEEISKEQQYWFVRVVVSDGSLSCWLCFACGQFVCQGANVGGVTVRIVRSCHRVGFVSLVDSSLVRERGDCRRLSC